MMGRPPTPSALKLLAGNPGKRPINQDEPKLELSEPNCPEYLDEVAQREWKRIVPILMRMRVLSEADEIQLANLCQTYATMIDAQTKLKQAGMLYKSKGGFVQANPLFGVVMKCLHMISKLSSEFGLSPSARVRLHSTPEPRSANKWSDVG
jgi:P27 family predicted phage terminase small subunit